MCGAEWRIRRFNGNDRGSDISGYYEEGDICTGTQHGREKGMGEQKKCATQSQ